MEELCISGRDRNVEKHVRRCEKTKSEGGTESVPENVLSQAIKSWKLISFGPLEGPKK